MGTLVVSHKDTDEILQVQGGIDDPDIGFVVIDKKGLSRGDYICQVLPEEYEPASFLKSKQVVSGAVVDRQETLAEAQSKALKEIRRKYAQVCAGTDPETGKDIYVDCTTDGTTYRMNAGKEASMMMDAGVRLTEQMGLTVMTVRDFNNANHNVELAVAKQIRNQQAADGHGHWLQKGAMVDAINSAATVEDVQTINKIFLVSIV